MKNKDEFQKYKLFTDTNNKYSYKQRANIMQVIKKNELKALNFDPMKYKRKLLNIQNPKKELAQNKEIQKITYTKKDPFRFFGPYNRSIICGGGFCKRLCNKNYNLNVIYDALLQKMPKYNKKTEQINLSSNENKDKFNHKTKKNRNEENILIEENNIFNTFTNNNNKNSKDKIRYNIKINNKNNSIENRHQKINITEVNNSIKYLKLAKNNLNDSSKEKSFKNKADKKNQNHLIDISNKKNQTSKNYQKLVFNGINHINNINKISIKKHPKLIPNLEINQTPLFTPRIEEYSKRILVKDTIEQFSMENTEIKKFNNLSEIDNILLKFSPINKSFDNKNLSHNYIISSDRIEYNIIKKIPKIEPKKKLIIKTNELVILSNSKPKINNNKDIINKSKEKEKEIILINNEENKEEKKEEKITIESEKKEESITKNNQKETKEDKNTNNNIKLNISENNEEEIIENRKPSRTVIGRLAKHRERLKKRNEANNKKEVNKPNKIKNIAFELESKMFKKEVEKEEENKIKTEIEKDKENYCKPISETNYNIPVIHKKKMKKKVFDGL